MKLFSLLPKRLVHFACNSPKNVLPSAARAPPERMAAGQVSAEPSGAGRPLRTG